MNWNHLADQLDTTLSTALSVSGESDAGNANGTVYVADAAPDIEDLIQRATETEKDRARFDEEGWTVVEDAWTLSEMPSFNYLSSPAGGSLIWWLLDAGHGRRYLVYQPDDEPAVVFARLEGGLDSLLGPVIERFLSTDGEVFGVEEAFVMLPDLIHNRAPELIPEEEVRSGALGFMDLAEQRYGGWENLSREHPDPQTRHEKEAAFADYWRRNYSEAENPFPRRGTQ